MSFHQHFNSFYNVISYESSHVKILALSLLTNSLAWQDHYEPLKAYKSLGLLCRVFKDSQCAQACKLLYVTLIRSKLLYYLLFNTVETISVKGYWITRKKIQRRAPNLSCLIIILNTRSDWSTTIIIHLWKCWHHIFLSNPSSIHLINQFSILKYVNFTSRTTRSAGTKLNPNYELL